jgi:protein TonB
MSISKNPRFDLKRKRKRVLETGMILALAFLIFAFKLFPDVGKYDLSDNYVPTGPFIDKPIPTDQKPNIPPPPEPEIIVPSPGDEEVPDIELTDTGLNPSAGVPDTPPPLDDDKDEDIDETPPFEWVEKMPTPIGGIEGIQKRIVYPELAVRASIEGKVYVRAFVDKKGNVYKVDILKSIGGGCDEAASEAVMNTRFSPGEQRGKPVKVMVSVPISFKLR